MRANGSTKLIPVEPEPTRKALGPWTWLLCLAAFELILAYSIPEGMLTQVEWLRAAVDDLATVFPVISNFDKIAVRPEIVRVYISITTLLIVPKVYLFIQWLDSDYLGTYRHLVISPLTRSAPASGREFLLGGDPTEQPVNREPGKPRSLFARFVGSLLMAGFLLFLAFVATTQWGYEISHSRETLPSIEAGYRRIASGGVGMWWEWELRTFFTALILAIPICVARDYWRYLRDWFAKRAGSRAVR